MSGKTEKRKRKAQNAAITAVLEEANKRNETFQTEMHALCGEYGKDIQAGVQPCLMFLDVDEKAPADAGKNKEFAEKFRALCVKHEMQPEARMSHNSQGALPFIIIVDHRKQEILAPKS
jgi:hypothetical protein